MIVEAQLPINASRAAVWAAVTDIEGAPKIVSGIAAIEIIDRPANGLQGLRWRETRLLYGKPATVEKWITAAAENDFYETRAESDGFVFITTVRLSGTQGNVLLTSCHASQPQTLARRLTMPMLWLFRGVMKKVILQDLRDIKSAVERAPAVQLNR